MIPIRSPFHLVSVQREYEYNQVCLECPEGVVCDEGITIENMEVEDGYWRVDGESDTILQCPISEACVGSSSNSYGDNLCRKGHEGPYCSVCINNYFKEYNGLCEICSTSSLERSYLLMGIMGVIGLMLIFLAIKFAYHASGQEGAMNALEDFQRRTMSFLGEKVRTLSKSANNNQEGSVSESGDEEIKKMIKGQLIGQKFKIMFVFFQVILLFQEVYLIQYPRPYVDFLALFSFIELDLFTVAKMDCAISGGFLSKLLFSTILPIGISLLLFIGWIVSRSKFGNDSRQFKIIENTLINLFIILTYVLFPSLCATIFSSFVCEDFDDGSSFLIADYLVDCDSSDYNSIYSLAIIMIFVYPIGIPLMALISKSNEFYVTF